MFWFDGGGLLPALPFYGPNAFEGLVVTKLFISFAGTMSALESGRVNRDDLACGLFLFACTRDHAMTPDKNCKYVEDIVTERPDLHRELVDALIKAEQDGRVRWRTVEDGNASFAMVDELLSSNGYERLNGDDKLMSRNYCYSTVERLCKQLEVIWRG